MAARDNDDHHLQRFVDAQTSVYGQVLAELRAGAKTSHWMWFVFPQLRGLGRSATARHYGLASLAEAGAYWRHPVLGARLKACTGIVVGLGGISGFGGRSAPQIFGTPDDLKFRSSMTLFSRAAPDDPVFERALAVYFHGEHDPRTLELLRTPAVE